MNLEERKNYLNAVYERALGDGLCRNVSQFAALIGVDRSGISMALGGSERHCTEALVKKVQRWEAQDARPQHQDIVIPAATAAFYQNLTEAMKNMSETIRLQQELISQLQGAHIQKKIG